MDWAGKAKAAMDLLERFVGIETETKYACPEFLELQDEAKKLLDCGEVAANGETKSVLERVSDVVAAWNAMADSFTEFDIPRVERLLASSKRGRALKQRLSEKWWREHYQSALKKLSTLIRSTPFFRGAKGWKPNFEWFVRPDTVTKLVEGSYAGIQDHYVPERETDSGSLF